MVEGLSFFCSLQLPRSFSMRQESYQFSVKELMYLDLAVFPLVVRNTFSQEWQNGDPIDFLIYISPFHYTIWHVAALSFLPLQAVFDEPSLLFYSKNVAHDYVVRDVLLDCFVSLHDSAQWFLFSMYQ